MNSDDSVKDGSGRDSPPQVPMDSFGSSVSSRLQEEYSQLLKYTIESTPGLKTVTSSDEAINVTNADLTDTDKRQSDDLMGGIGDPPLPTAIDTEVNVNSNNDDDDYLAPVVDMTVAAMGSKLDGWFGKLKGDVLEEVLAALMASLDSQQQENKRSTKEIQTEKTTLQKEINRLTERMNGMEHSLQQKSTVVNNLTDSLAAQKDKLEMAKLFYTWKAEHTDKQREIFTEKLATQHHERKLNLRVLKSWYGLIQTRWRSRVERKSQTQAKGVCLELTSDYEAKISMLNNNISSLEKKVSVLQAEREMYSEQVKNAFMRGMCALNMETMSVFGEQSHQSEHTQQPPSDEHRTLGVGDGVTDTTKSVDEVSSSDFFTSNNILESNGLSKEGGSYSKSLHFSGAINSQHLTDTAEHQQTQLSSISTSVPSAKVTRQQPPVNQFSQPTVRAKSRPVSGRGCHTHRKNVSPSQSLAPPMASIVVERHQPITKQTVGKATAVRYPRTGSNSIPINFIDKDGGKIHFQPLAGQKDRSMTTKDICIKVVE